MEEKTTELVNYQFIALPQKVAAATDAYCLSVLALFIQKESYWKEKESLDEYGYFFIANDEIQKRIGFKRDVVKETIEALHRKNLIKVIPSKRKTEANRYKINWDTIHAYDRLSLEELQLPMYRINKVTRGESLTYAEKNANNDAELNADCTSTVDNLNNINKENNIVYNNIDNISNNNIYNGAECTIIDENNSINEINNSQPKEESKDSNPIEKAYPPYSFGNILTILVKTLSQRECEIEPFSKEEYLGCQLLVDRLSQSPYKNNESNEIFNDLYNWGESLSNSLLRKNTLEAIAGFQQEWEKRH